MSEQDLRNCPTCATPSPPAATFCGRCGDRVPGAGGDVRATPSPRTTLLVEPPPDDPAADHPDVGDTDEDRTDAHGPDGGQAPAASTPRRRLVRAGGALAAVALLVAVTVTVAGDPDDPTPWPLLPPAAGADAPALAATTVAHGGGVTAVSHPAGGVTLLVGPDGTATLPPVVGTPHVTDDGVVEVVADGALVRLDADGTVLDRLPLTPTPNGPEVPSAGATGLVAVAPLGRLATIVGDQLLVIDRTGTVLWGCGVPAGSALHPVALGSTPLALAPDGGVVGCTPGLRLTWTDVTAPVEVVWSGRVDEGPRLLAVVDGEARLHAAAPLVLTGAIVDPPGPDPFELAAHEVVVPGPADGVVAAAGTTVPWLLTDADRLRTQDPFSPGPPLLVDTARARTLLAEPKGLDATTLAVAGDVLVLRAGGDLVGLTVPRSEDPDGGGAVDARVAWSATGPDPDRFERIVPLDADTVAAIGRDRVVVLVSTDGRVLADVALSVPADPAT